jgi:hypothetical protein
MRSTLLSLLIGALLGASGTLLAAPTGDELPELSSVLSLFSAHASGSDGVRLNWTLDRQSPTIVKFRIYRGYEEIGNFAVLTEINATSAMDTAEYSFEDKSARPGVSYFYKLAAVGQKNESVFPVVITATPPQPGHTVEVGKLAPATVLAGDKITLYVRRAGRVKLDLMTTPPKALVNDNLRPGVYEFDPPPAGDGKVSLHLEHEEGYNTDFTWPIQ